ncbi:hypothetical protein CI109_105759 [Kwoniella shandongensis]|uniref:pH-response transcription factor pacC/RIM101 n=1 Tax=Kwoniella shandongensis TaxID=1734106 RepID=A0A5M6C093_9TREE|nr:uncharacterized protein CI109_003098 [Kwoniella shandongensis]KAA5528566.1 hypothetical protein CI109_003098 [Kwoniella shandongensis]
MATSFNQFQSLFETLTSPVQMQVSYDRSSIGQDLPASSSPYIPYSNSYSAHSTTSFARPALSTVPQPRAGMEDEEQLQMAAAWAEIERQCTPPQGGHGPGMYRPQHPHALPRNELRHSQPVYTPEVEYALPPIQYYSPHIGNLGADVQPVSHGMWEYQPSPPTMEYAQPTQIMQTGSWEDRDSRVLKGKKHVCAVCSKKFNRPSALVTHTSVHTGVKPYMCRRDGCGRTFSVQSNLRRHQRTHERKEAQARETGCQIDPTISSDPTSFSSPFGSSLSLSPEFAYQNSQQLVDWYPYQQPFSTTSPPDPSLSPEMTMTGMRSMPSVMGGGNTVSSTPRRGPGGLSEVPNGYGPFQWDITVGAIVPT